MIELYIFWNKKPEVSDAEMQNAINQNHRYINETELFVSKPENMFNIVDMGTGWYGMSKYTLKSQEGFEEFMSDDHELHNEVGSGILPLLDESNPYTAIAVKQ